MKWEREKPLGVNWRRYFSRFFFASGGGPALLLGLEVLQLGSQLSDYALQILVDGT